MSESYQLDIGLVTKKDRAIMDRRILIESKNTGRQWRLPKEDVNDFFVGRRRAFYRVFWQTTS